MQGNRKGSSFERKICKQLSEWWSYALEGTARDDIFWRSSQSGGRATQRAKSGKKTFGSQGDIAAVDPVGRPLLEVFTLELKRGRSHGNLGDCVDTANDKRRKPNKFEETLLQAISQAQAAGSQSWLVIAQRDRRRCMVYGERRFFRRMLMQGTDADVSFPYVLARHPSLDYLQVAFIPFRGFLKMFEPKKILWWAASAKSKYRSKL